MMYNNPATSGVDMSPELLVRMFDTIDNVSMVKESTGDLSRMQHIDKISGRRLPFCNGSNSPVLDALRAGAAGRCTAAPCLRPQPCIFLYDCSARWRITKSANHLHRAQALLEFIVAGGLATTVKAGWS